MSGQEFSKFANMETQSLTLGPVVSTDTAQPQFLGAAASLPVSIGSDYARSATATVGYLKLTETTTERSIYISPGAMINAGNFPHLEMSDSVPLSNHLNVDEIPTVEITKAVRVGAILVLIFCAASCLANGISNSVVHPIILIILAVGAGGFILMSVVAEKNWRRHVG